MGILDRIKKEIETNLENVQAYEDYYHICKADIFKDKDGVISQLKWLSEEIEKNISEIGDNDEMLRLYRIHKRVLLVLAPWDFESYMLYVEWERDPDKKFYIPRRKALHDVVKSLQDLADDKLDILSISLPPGVGKSTLAIFYLTWIAGREPNKPSLIGSHSNSFIRGAYDECLRILDPAGEYLWSDVFSGLSVTSTNAKDCRIDIDRRQRFETLEFTSVGTGNAGLYRAMSLLYCDDLVSGLEVALSKERLDKLWGVYTTDLRQRKQGSKCKELHIATRWSVHDVIGRLEREYEGNARAKFIRVPAMDENDESNFFYPYDVGFTTEQYREQREIMDEASWKAVYMNEPIEREGLLYHEEELRRYFELPDGEPDAIIGICDTKDRGKDYAFLPVGYKFGNDYYIEDCVCDNGLPHIVDARLVAVLMINDVQMCRFESNSAGGRIAEKVNKEIKEKGGNTRITTKYTTANKETKIIVNSGWVKEHCLFKDRSLYRRQSDYGKMMDMLCSYTVLGKNKHDDVPDGMAMFSEFAQSLTNGKIEVFGRPI